MHRLGREAAIIIRSLLFTAYFWTLSVVMTVGYVPALFVGGREAITRGQARWARCVMWGLRVICGTTFEVHGVEHVPQGAALFAAKHMSAWDTIIFHMLLPDPAFVMKSTLLFVPLYGAYAKKTRMIAVDRGGGAKALRQLIRDGRARIAEGRQIVIFPEGTRVRPGAPPDYKSGVAALYQALDLPCIPIALNSGLFWPRQGLIRRPGTISLVFLPPIPPGLPRETFMPRLQEDIESATGRLLEKERNKAVENN